ncbi:AIG2-like protein D isoform X3 [Zingiber officinale]|uniref:AIG2-like protein D isoform X3 n=1 Tax=Zingiber officinale TaxID=94328 RepID=UPI001C4CE23D|nr:AIG2-like protein D isoform X3 [Zingiber officinale]
MAVATNVSAPHTVFVYDTLMDDQVVQALLKHVPPSSSAVLNHYHRYSIKGRVYPAILPVETKKVTGKVLFGITNVELDVLDAFEDIEYERRVVEVSLLDKTEKLLVNAYVWSDKNDPNLYSEWDFESLKFSLGTTSSNNCLLFTSDQISLNERTISRSRSSVTR